MSSNEDREDVKVNEMFDLYHGKCKISIKQKYLESRKQCRTKEEEAFLDKFVNYILKDIIWNRLRRDY